MKIEVTNDLSAAQVSDVMGVLRRPRILIPTDRDYPRHADWLDKTEAAIAKGSKRAMLGKCDGRAVGVVVYRQGDEPSVIDIRNISILEEFRSQLYGAFLLRQTEHDAMTNDYPEAKYVQVIPSLPISV